MAVGLNGFVQTLRRVVDRQSLADQSDAQLLESFVTKREQAAFEVLVRRHGGMVLTVCRRQVRNSHDADDAFQATFMTLARKAGAIRGSDAVGAWLYKVALRIAIRARARTSRRASCEEVVSNLAELAPVSDPPPGDMRRVMDEEIGRLPEKYRLAVILHYLEGRTVLEAARILGCPKGTVLSRLARAREHLRTRLVRRGVAGSAGMVAAALAQPSVQAAVPAHLARATVLAAMQPTAAQAMAAGVISLNAAALSEGVLRIMVLCKLKTLSSLALAVTLLGGGVGVFAYRTVVAGTPESPTEASFSTSFGEPGPKGPASKSDTTQDSQPPADKSTSAPGWQWLLTPRTTKSHEWSHGGVVCLVEADQDGAQLVYLAYSGNFKPSSEQYRPVVFDANGKRYLLRPARGGSSNQGWGKGPISMICYRLDPKELARDKVAYIGIEANVKAGK
jgi:RNA polymerase sigma factor (sigma-70 family)